MNYVTPEIHIISLIDETIQIGKKDLKVFVVSRTRGNFLEVSSEVSMSHCVSIIFTSLHFLIFNDPSSTKLEM